MLQLTKFDVAERQLHQAIALFFAEGDPVSIHTLAEAAAQILYDIRTRFGGHSFRRDSDKIRDEYKKEWMTLLTSARNFFKHGDRDGDAVHSFNVDLNRFTLLDAVYLYKFAKKAQSPECLLFTCWLAANHSHLFKNDTFPEAIRLQMSDPEMKSLKNYSELLTMIRAKNVPFPGVELRLGLPVEPTQTAE